VREPAKKSEYRRRDERDGVRVAKIRIYELARELGLESKDVVEMAIELGFEAKTASSSLEADDADRVASPWRCHGRVRGTGSGTGTEPEPTPEPEPEPDGVGDAGGGRAVATPDDAEISASSRCRRA
jgi:translation initiation factor IF-2